MNPDLEKLQPYPFEKLNALKSGVTPPEQPHIDTTDLPAREIVERGLGIAADICVFTNHNLVIEELDCNG